MKVVYTLILIIYSFSIFCQDITLKRVEPPHWWVGMENDQLQLLVHGDNIAATKPSLQYEGVTLKEITRLESNNYLFLNLSISTDVKAGSFNVEFAKPNGETLVYSYELKTKGVRKQRTNSTVTGADVMYLITPDRFANADPTNDSTDDTIEQADRKNPDGRHGGDLKGVVDHLDYIEGLGVTTLWLNPFLENDQPKYSYHGYGISDFYKTDARFGTNQDFLDLVDQCHSRNLKIIMDQVFNHCGSGHWWMNDLPAADWLNQWPTYTQSSFTNISVSDPYGTQSDFDLHSKGWFDTNLPDLNQENKYLEKYLIQNSIWWIEYANLDGIRMDTYPYPDKNVMARWARTVQKEYPNFYIVAETSEISVASTSYWNKGGANKDGFISHVRSVSDYPLFYAMLRSFGEENSTYRIYETLAYDYLYGTPFNNKIFNGNHDVPRLFNALNKDKDKVKLSFAFILTTRGIPQFYYGDELLFEGSKPDGILRKDFPGGWAGDKSDLFGSKDRTPDENEVYQYVKKILQWRKEAVEIHEGKLKHYKPQHEVYVYFRTLDNKTTMVILNNSDRAYADFDLGHYYELLKGYTTGTDIISGKKYGSLNSISLESNTAYIIALGNN
ncbi:MAG: glycoside hydrolase family 13 protein [Cyclobacteriaceae bacterium]